MFKCLNVRLLTALLAGAGILAASGQAAPSEFEVASIHMVGSGHTLEELKRGIGEAYVSPYGTNKFTARNIPLEFLISVAFGVEYNQISDKEDWLDEQLYDVVAEVDPTVKLTREQTQPLLRHLLETRFHLKTHTEEVQLPGYALVAAKGEPKLKPSSQSKPQAQILPNGLRATGVPMKFLAAMLQRPTGKPVVDETGISGNFDFNLSYAPENATDSPLPSIFTAIQDQLGLKLQPKKILIQKLIIDHVERTPDEN